jgi:3-oxoacyl-[acyl-carrier-protein] synthase II
MRAALLDACTDGSDIDYINAHGTSTGLGDLAETIAIKRTFNQHAKKLIVNSTKSMTGHLLGGAGGLESVITALAIQRQTSPPTTNLLNPDPDCDLDYCANAARDVKIKKAIKNAFGFGGTNGSLVFGRI